MTFATLECGKIDHERKPMTLRCRGCNARGCEHCGIISFGSQYYHESCYKEHELCNLPWCKGKKLTLVCDWCERRSCEDCIAVYINKYALHAHCWNKVSEIESSSTFDKYTSRNLALFFMSLFSMILFAALTCMNISVRKNVTVPFIFCVLFICTTVMTVRQIVSDRQMEDRKIKKYKKAELSV